MEELYIAFENHDLIAEGTQAEVAVKLKRDFSKSSGTILIFSQRTGKQIDLNLSGSVREVQSRYAPVNKSPEESSSKVGRPKLGVVSREVSLLPRHWEWLASQPSSASATIRKLIEDAQKRNRETDLIRLSQEAANRFMSMMAGDLVGYEDALRALYARDEKTLKANISTWPKDIRNQILKYAKDAL